VPGHLLSRRYFLGAACAAPLAFRGARAIATTATRVVALDLLPTELLLTLGVTPLAIANAPLYRRLVAEPALPDAVPDLGPLTEPNAEFLQVLRPDAILLAAWQSGSVERLSRIAPLVPLQTIAGTVPATAHAAALLREVGALTARTTEAEHWIARMEREMGQAREALGSRDTRPLYVCRFAANGRNVALFGGNGLVGDVIRQLGLRNAWKGRVNASGVVSVGIEQLAADPEARIIHFDRGAETVRAMENLSRSALWRALPAVRAGRLTTMPVVYPSGGVSTAIRFARQLAEALTQEVSNG
jgi:iron complex transport system substrate-binding protein